MTLVQLFQIVAAGRWRILFCVLACIAGAMWFASELPPTYEARARVMLELASPDLVTGTEVNSKGTEQYVRTQQLLAMSEGVALRVVDKLGWAQNPAVIEAFNGSSGGAGDVRKWAAQRIMSATSAVPLEGGGTLELIYQAPEPEAAALIAGLVRESYIETALALQTEGAARRADRYDVLAGQARTRLAIAEAAYTKLQRETGVVADVNGNDLESRALGHLQQNIIAAEMSTLEDDRSRGETATTLALRGQLLALERQIALDAGTLGETNPQLQSLLARRDSARNALTRVLAAERPSGAAAGRAMANEAEAAYRDERARMLARGPNALKLAQARRVVTLQRSDLERIMANGATLRMLSERTESGLVVMGDVIAKRDPVAPNVPVIALLATLFGLGLGLVAVILDGLLRREVLSTADLAFATGLPVIGVLPRGPKSSLWRSWRRRLRKPGLAPV